MRYGRSKCNQLARKKIITKDASCSETDLLVLEFFFVTMFSFSDMVDFLLDIRSELVWDLEIFANLIQKL